MIKKPEILETKIVGKGRFIEVEDIYLRFSNGNERVFERLKGRLSGAVMIAPMLDEDRWYIPQITRRLHHLIEQP